MATISVSDIRPVGSDLFLDDDKYMNDLGDNELNHVVGGTEPITGTLLATAFLAGVAIGISLNNE